MTDDDTTTELDEKVEATPADETPADETLADETPAGPGIDWARVLAFGVLPALALLLALAAGALKYLDDSVSDSNRAAMESVQAARDATVAILSYKPDTVEQQLNDARNLLSGEFQESYTSLINDVVIPGAKQKQITAVATAPDNGASVVSAESNRAVVLVFVNQTVVVGAEAPTDTASSVLVTLDKVDGKWLISAFDPV